MSMPPGETPEPPTSPMTPAPRPNPASAYPGGESYPLEPSPYSAPQPPAYASPPPTYEASGYELPAPPPYAAPSAPPAYEAPAPPAYVPPSGYTAPPPPYTAPRQYPGGISVSSDDPLVPPPGSPFSAWFTIVQSTAKRSWKSALIIATLGIAGPRALVGIVDGFTGWGGSMTFGLFRLIFNGFDLIGLLVSLLVAVAGCYLASIGWAAGVWALVQEAATGRPASIGQAIGYGLKRAAGLFPWTLAAGAVFTVAWAIIYLPGLYVAFALSLFGLVAVFERGGNPLLRSVTLTHNSRNLGPTLGKVGIALGGYAVLASIAHAVFFVIAAIARAATGAASGSFDVRETVYAVVIGAGELFTGPAFAVLLICLLPTYAELRARENGGSSTAQLQQLLG